MNFIFRDWLSAILSISSDDTLYNLFCVIKCADVRLMMASNYYDTAKAAIIKKIKFKDKYDFTGPKDCENTGFLTKDYAQSSHLEEKPEVTEVKVEEKLPENPIHTEEGPIINDSYYSNTGHDGPFGTYG